MYSVFVKGTVTRLTHTIPLFSHKNVYDHLPIHEEIKEPHLPMMLQARSYTQSLNAQDTFRPIPGLISYTLVTGEMVTTITQSSST